MDFIHVAVYFEYKRLNCSALYQGYPFKKHEIKYEKVFANDIHFNDAINFQGNKNHLRSCF